MEDVSESEIEFLEIEENLEYKKIIDKVLKQCFIEEKFDNRKVYISVILTNEENIRKINKQYRNIDKETDVLSFPMFEKSELENLKVNSVVREVLGDIIISIPEVKVQALEYGHSFERELAYMVVHGFYHIIGYDHMNEDEKEIMREREENILKKLNIKRG